ncbi:MAG: 30S ribosomal protein S20 [Acidobacteria bacterium]|nr:MAG: 30S ribosomal protein S20 [Acidobacteriota bacterium]
MAARRERLPEIRRGPARPRKAAGPGSAGAVGRRGGRVVARIKSAVKNIRKTRRRRAVNIIRRGRLRSQIKRLRSLLAKKDAGGASRELARTLSLLDKSIGTGIIHRNTAARHKSRLTRQVNALQAVR